MTQKIKRILTNWHGRDESKEESLFQYGLVVRWVPKHKSYQCIFRCSMVPKAFRTGWMSEQEFNALMQESWVKDRLKDFLSYLGCSLEEYMSNEMSYKLCDFIEYFGAEEIFGCSYDTMTARQACKMLGVKFYPEYECA